MRPLIVGYLNPRPFTTADELGAMRAELTAYADEEGYCLDEIYIEQVGNQASALNALIVVAKREEITAVVVPALYHFARFPGLQLAMKELLEHQAGVRVLVMNPIPEGPA